MPLCYMVVKATTVSEATIPVRLATQILLLLALLSRRFSISSDSTPLDPLQVPVNTQNKAV